MARQSSQDPDFTVSSGSATATATEPQKPTEPQTLPPFVAIPPDTEWPTMQSMNLTAIAAGKGPAELGVINADRVPAQYPLLMYNRRTRTTKAAKDEKEKADLASKGYSEEPFPAEDPNAITAGMLLALQDVWTKAGEALKTLMQLVEQQKKPPDAPPTPPTST